MIAQDFARVRVLGAFSPGSARGHPSQEDRSARGHPSQEKRRKHSRALWCSDHVHARGWETRAGRFLVLEAEVAVERIRRNSSARTAS